MSRISQLLTLGLVTAGVTWLAKSRNMASNPNYAMGRDTVRKHQTTSGTTNRSMRGSSMKSDMADRSVTHSYSPAHSSSHSSGTDGSSSVYDNPLATGSAVDPSSPGTVRPGTYGPGSSSRQ